MRNKQSFLRLKKIPLKKDAISEINLWIKKAKAAWKINNFHKLRLATEQILFWLDYGASLRGQIKLKLTRKSSPKALGMIEGEYITIFLEPHDSFNEYLDTIIHEWLHRWEYKKYGDISPDLEHGPAFYSRLTFLKKYF